jgi:ribosomal protein S12 methylthiotransferase accessory factor
MDLAAPSLDRIDALPAPSQHAPAKPPLHTPVAFGHWRIAGDQLECRLPREVLAVRAPRRLLRDVLRLCDGTRSWADVVDALAARWARDDVTAFLAGLAHARALVEAGELWAHWSALAQLPQPGTPAAGPEEIAQLPLQAERRLPAGAGTWDASVRDGHNPVAATLRLRESIRTFDDQPVTLQVLCSILWAAHGVVRASGTGAPRWHRTVASGGNMHSARWFVAVLRGLPSADASQALLPAGVYEARFPTGGGASLQPLSTAVQAAWNCLRDPRVLRHATALILPLWDIAVPARKYGNRATLFATLEAGQCLQNAQLMAASLGAACMLRGDTVAAEAIALAAVERAGHHWLSVPGMVVGAMPTAQQKEQQAAESRFRVAPNVQPRGASAPQFAFAAVATEAADEPVAASGRAPEPRTALDICEAEAWERVGWATLARSIEASACDLTQALDPRELVAYSARQHRTPGFPFGRFERTRAYLWIDAADAETGAVRAVPAECVHALHALPPRFQRGACTNASTSGMAGALLLEDALARATLELVERDAFCRSWLSGSPAAGIAPTSLPAALQSRLAELQAQGAEATVVDLSTPWCIVAAVFLQSAGMPFTAITAAAGFDAESAVAKALSEVEGRLAHAQQFPCVRDTADPLRRIENFYRHPRSYRRSDFFRPLHAARPFGEVGGASARDWSQMRARMRADGARLLCAEVTPPGAAIAQGRLPVRVVRALVPGLVPIWFQAGLQPAGLRRFAEACASPGARPAGHFLHPFT